MKITYDQGAAARTIRLNKKEIESLKDFARAVMTRMQSADRQFADCWTACGIDFDGLQPEFQWGSKNDIRPGDHAIFVSA